MCALVELGCTHYATGLGGLSISHHSEREIYRVISSPLPYFKTPGYSLPPQIARYAIELGLGAVCYVPRNFLNNTLSAFYANIRPELESLGVEVVDDSMPLLQRNQRALRVVRRLVIGLHWILIRPDTSWMDPDGGKEHTFFLNTVPEIYPGDTGISLVLTRQS
ncbi:hypothetical protein VQ02_06860 [Methylobacterium variabile]|uniref:Uncharacterized protein n=2 Tax=Methylobacterium variabile TaxID=298794 RepID=A0A0J6T4Z3_9HYPH|nr:hypothetical protein VQ02_06860 [Methylobacterium variabile]